MPRHCKWMMCLQYMGLIFMFLHMLKMKGVNLIIMTFTLTWYVVCYEVLGLSTPSVMACWGHVMSKCCQYAIEESKVCVGLPSISNFKTWLVWKKASLGARKVVRDHKNATRHVTTIIHSLSNHMILFDPYTYPFWLEAQVLNDMCSLWLNN